MNYYKRHLGDYARKTAHLSLLEHGVYNVLLDAYYDRERPLSEPEAIRLSRARTDEELCAVNTVLSEFFIEENGRFYQQHADEIIEDFHKRQKTNRKLGSLGGKRNATRVRSESLEKIEANDKPSHKPLATNQEEEEKKKKPSPPATALPAPPEFLDAEAWAGFVAVRAKIRNPLTPRGARLAFAKLGRLRDAGHDPNEILDNSTFNGWRGLFAPRPEDTNANRTRSRKLSAVEQVELAVGQRRDAEEDSVAEPPGLRLVADG